MPKRISSNLYLIQTKIIALLLLINKTRAIIRLDCGIFIGKIDPQTRYCFLLTKAKRLWHWNYYAHDGLAFYTVGLRCLCRNFTENAPSLAVYLKVSPVNWRHNEKPSLKGRMGDVHNIAILKEEFDHHLRYKNIFILLSNNKTPTR